MPTHPRLALLGAAAALALLGACSSPAPNNEPADTTTAEESETSEAATEVELPDVVGKNTAIAYDELTALGFTNIQLGSADEEDTVVIVMANWTVVDQEPAAGEMLSTEATIVLTNTKE